MFSSSTYMQQKKMRMNNTLEMKVRMDMKWKKKFACPKLVFGILW